MKGVGRVGHFDLVRYFFWQPFGVQEYFFAVHKCFFSIFLMKIFFKFICLFYSFLQPPPALIYGYVSHSIHLAAVNVSSRGSQDVIELTSNNSIANKAI